MKLRNRENIKFVIYLLALLLTASNGYIILQRFLPTENPVTIFEQFRTSNTQKIKQVSFPKVQRTKELLDAIKLKPTSNTNYFVFQQYDHQYLEPLYWSTNSFMPTEAVMQHIDSIGEVVTNLIYYNYHRKTYQLEGKSIIVCITQTHYKNYPNNNKYLIPTWLNAPNTLLPYHYTKNNIGNIQFSNTVVAKSSTILVNISTLLFTLLLIWIVIHKSYFNNKLRPVCFGILFLLMLQVAVYISSIRIEIIPQKHIYAVFATQLALLALLYILKYKQKFFNIAIICLHIIGLCMLLYKSTPYINISQITSIRFTDLLYMLSICLLLHIILVSYAQLFVSNNDGFNFFSIELSNIFLRATIVAICASLLILLVNNYNNKDVVKKTIPKQIASFNTKQLAYVNQFETIVHKHIAARSNDIDYAYQYMLKNAIDSFATVNNLMVQYYVDSAEPHIVDKNYKYISIAKNNIDSLIIRYKIEIKKNETNSINSELFFKDSSWHIQDMPFAVYIYYNNKPFLKNTEAEMPIGVKEAIAQKKLGTHHRYELQQVGDYTIATTNTHFSFIAITSSFAYLLLIQFITLGIIYTLNTLYARKPFAIKNISLPTKIFLIVSSIIVVSFLIISFFILRMFKEEQIINNGKQLSNASQILINEIKNSLQNTSGDEAITLYDINVNEKLKQLMLSVSSIQESDINVYNKNGKLEVTTQPYLFNSNFISRYINYNVYQKLLYTNPTELITFENIGNLEYQSIYMPLKDKNDYTFAYINIPHYASKANFEREINTFIATIATIMAIIILLALILGYYFTSIISKPLSLIAEKMNKADINASYTPIDYDSKDEIGTLVKQYNEMQAQLQININKLAKNERELAWRQMARQVAHEIKNPLTPMKLKIQLLERNMKLERGNLTDMVKDTNALLIDQINHLAQIASDFSEFAQIEAAVKAPINNTYILEKTVALYEGVSNIIITFNNTAHNDYLLADHTQLNRLYINIIKNAIEAGANNKVTNIELKQFNSNNNLIVSITDNGSGIPLEVIDQLFTPNFTTKNSGTGLGLAMCKTIVEHHNGTINFETGSSGTTFNIIFPAINNA